MCSNILCVTAVLLGIDAGWRPLPGGGVEYLIQIEPHVLATLESGTPIQSDIPPQVKDVRAYRITVGKEQLPRELPVPDNDSSGETKPTAGNPPADPWLPPFSTPRIKPGFPDGPLLLPGASSAGSPPVPNILSPDPTGKPIAERQAVYVAPADTTPEPVSESAFDSPSDFGPLQDERAKPWPVLTVTLLGLFASLGGNAFLLWVAVGLRNRCRALLKGTNDLPPQANQVHNQADDHRHDCKPL